MKKTNQSGFSAVEVLLVLILVAILGFTGYYVYHAQSNANKTLDTADKTAASQTQAPKKKTTPSALKSPTVALDNNAVSFTIPNGFEVVPSTQQSSNVAKTSCYKAVTSTVTCLDNDVLIIKSQGYTNTDQFQISVSVYKKDPGLSARDWFYENNSNELGLGYGTNSTLASFTIDGVPAIEYHDIYSDEDRVSYAVAKADIGVVVHSNTFSGSTYYSYKNTSGTDYRTYLPTIKILAQSVKINAN